MGFGIRSSCLIYNTVQDQVLGIGTNALQSVTTGISNYAVGLSAGISVTSGQFNILIGVQVGYHLTTGCYNTLIGWNTGYGVSATCGIQHWNTMVGYGAGELGGLQNYNTIIGLQAGYGNCGCCNVMIGTLAGYSGTRYSTLFNTFIGYYAGCTVTTGNCNTIIGTCHNLAITSGNQHLLISAGQTAVTFCPTAQIWANTTGFGFGNTAPACAVHVTGNVVASLDITAYYSDRRLKENIIIIDCAIEKIQKIKGVSYNVNKLGQDFGFEDTGLQYGLLADEVEKVLPEAVTLAPFDLDENKNSRTGENYQTVKYEKVIPLLIESIKELDNRIEKIYTKIRKVKIV